MTITSLEPQKRNPKRVSVYVDGTFAFGLKQEWVEELGLREGIVIDREKLDKLLFELQYRQARDYALLLLTYKARTRAELKQRLDRKTFSPEVVQAVLAKLEEKKVIDDARFAQGFTDDRINIGHKGIWRVRAELVKRGVAREQIDEALAAAPDEAQAAREVMEQYSKRYARLEPDVRKRRLYALLARRGFSVETIRDVMGGGVDGG
jgi:regulatory protein